MDLQRSTAAVEQEVRLRHVPFALADLLAFLEDSRTQLQAGPAVPHPPAWADAFLAEPRAAARSGARR